MKKIDMKSMGRIITLALLVLMVYSQGIGSPDEFKKEYSEKFDVNPNAMLVIQNKFGDVHCQNWDQNSISIDVTVTVDASSQEKADKVTSKISVNLKGDKSKVEGITEVGDMNFNNVEFRIDYNIKMPSSINIDFTNKFGEIYLERVDGNATILLEYGQMEAENLLGKENRLNIKFSNAEVDMLGSAVIDLEYGKLEIDQAGNLEARTRFSHMEADKTGDLKLDSQYDDLEFEGSGSVNLVSRFSDVKFGTIAGDFDLESQYGGISVDGISSGFRNGRVENSFAGVTLRFEPNASFSVDARLDFGSLSYPKGNSSISHQEEGYTTNIYEGNIGNTKSAQSALVIRSKNGDVKIEYK